ncbi:hypothetical protein BJX64DRAFT_290659 [Aspergillus heterothallicus]
MSQVQGRPAFDFTDIKEIYPALLNLRLAALSPNTEISDNHLGPLTPLAQDLQVGPQALDNAWRLGTGYKDLAVVLLEPSDKAESHYFEEMVKASRALRTVDETLCHASTGHRDIENTIILDIRAFRSDLIRKEQSTVRRLEDDEKAYGAFDKILHRLQPECILVCQCQTNTDDVKNSFARQICSSVGRATDLGVFSLPRTGHEVLLVKSFHPMYLEYKRNDPDDSRTKAVMREYLFDATFIVALNALLGRKITGHGLRNLRSCAKNGRAIKFREAGVSISWRWVDESSIANSNFIERLQNLGIFDGDEDKRRLDELLSLKFQARGRHSGGTIVGRGEFRKKDILEILGPIKDFP